MLVRVNLKEDATAASLETYKTVVTSLGKVELRTFDPAHMDITSKRFLFIDDVLVAEFFRRPSGKGISRFRVKDPTATEKIASVLVDIISR